MVTEEELVAGLLEAMGDDMLSEGARQYLAEGLLSKYVIVERPDVGTVEPLEGTFPGATDDRVVFGGRVMNKAGMKGWSEHLKEAEYALKQAVRRCVEWKTCVDFAKERESAEKHARCEAISKELGHPVYMYAPQPIKTLIARLVDAEFKNEWN